VAARLQRRAVTTDHSAVSLTAAAVGGHGTNHTEAAALPQQRATIATDEMPSPLCSDAP
jgi:hypothetical protein